MKNFVRDNAFTLAMLPICAFLYSLSNKFGGNVSRGGIGPDAWPKAAILLIVSVSFLELAVYVFKHRREVGAVAQEAAKAEDGEEKTLYPRLLYAGCLLTTGYVAVVEYFGFTLTTYAYLVAFMYIGRYRNHKVIWGSSLIGALVMLFVFVKVVYVSLPEGVAPFNALTWLLYRLMNVN